MWQLSAVVATKTAAPGALNGKLPGRHLPDQVLVDDSEGPASGDEPIQDVVGGRNVEGQVWHVLVDAFEALQQTERPFLILRGHNSEQLFETLG